jgi:hypothetical protein
MAKSKRIRNFLFQGHRYLGLVLGILIAIAVSVDNKQDILDSLK